MKKRLDMKLKKEKMIKYNVKEREKERNVCFDNKIKKLIDK